MPTLAHDAHGHGPPLLLLHGFGGCRHDWRHVFDLDALAREHRVIRPDLLAHGDTGGDPPPRIHRESARAVLALLDELAVDRCVAIGCSMGGNVLLHAALLDPERIDAMVIAGATPYVPAQARALMRQQPGAAFLADEHEDMNLTPPQLATLRARTLVVNGDRDPLYPVELSVDLYRGIPRSALWVIPEAEHGPIWGEHAAAFATRALAFLRR